MSTIMRYTRCAPGKRRFLFALALICIVIAQPAFCQTIQEPRYSLDDAVVLVKQSFGSDHSWLATFAIGNLNRRNARPNTVADNKTRYREVELSHRRTLWIGDLLAGVGFDYRKDTVTGIKDEDIRVYVEWGVIC